MEISHLLSGDSKFLPQVFNQKFVTTLLLCQNTKEVFNYKHLTKICKELERLSISLKMMKSLFCSC